MAILSFLSSFQSSKISPPHFWKRSQANASNLVLLLITFKTRNNDDNDEWLLDSISLIRVTDGDKSSSNPQFISVNSSVYFWRNIFESVSPKCGPSCTWARFVHRLEQLFWRPSIWGSLCKWRKWTVKTR